MTRRSTRTALSLTLVTATLLLVLACGRASEPVSLSYFFLPLCPTCPETAQMEAIAGELTGIARAHNHVSVAAHDVRRDGGASALREAAEAAGVDVRMLAFPVLFENERVHEGFEEIEDYLSSW